MGESSRSGRSELPFEKHHPGCMESLLHFLDLHQRLRIRKMLAYRKHGGGTRDGRPKVMEMNHNVPSTSEAPCCPEKDANFLMKGKGNASSRSSGMALMKGLVSKPRSKEKGKNIKMSPLASQLLRTISVHNSESNYCLLHDKQTSSHEIPTETTLHEADSSSSYQQSLVKTPAKSLLQGRCEMCGSINSVGDIDHNHLDQLDNELVEKQYLLQEKLTKVKGALVKQKGKSPTKNGSNASLYQSQEFMDLMDLFRANRDLFLKVLQDPSFLLTNNPHEQQASSEQTGLLKYGTILGSGLSRQSNASDDQDVNFQVQETATTPRTKENGENKAIHMSVIDRNIGHITDSSHESRKQNNVRTEEKGMESISGKEINIPKPVVAAIDSSVTESNIVHLPDSPSESRKKSDVHTVSDHFKSIKQKIKDVIKENKKEHTRICKDGILHKIPYGHKMTEVAKKYNLKITYGRERPALSNRKDVLRGMRRSSSHTESLGRYSNLFKSTSRKDSENFGSLNSMEEATTLHDRNSPKAFRRIFSLPEIKSQSVSSNDQNDVSIAPQSVKMMSDPELNDTASVHCISHQFETLDAPVCADGTILSDTQVELTIEENSSGTVHGGLGQRVSLDVNWCEMFSSADDLMSEDGPCGIAHVEVIEVPPSPRTISPPTTIQADHISSAKHSMSGPEMICEQIDSEELELSITPEKHLDLDSTYNEVGDTDAELEDINYLHIHVDERDEAEFQYVKDILFKAGFSGRAFLGEWFSPDQPMDPLLFEKAEGSSLEFVSGDEPGSTLNHLLLFDLINEVLLEIYDVSFVSCPQFSHFDSRTRPMPVGYHVLEEVWANISHHLSSQLQLGQTVEKVVARDFARSDGWMNLQYDSKHVALELEDLILDDLLDDVVLQSEDIVMSQYICS